VLTQTRLNPSAAKQAKYLVWRIRKISAATTKLLKQGFRQNFYKRNNLKHFFLNSRIFLKEKEPKIKKDNSKLKTNEKRSNQKDLKLHKSKQS
jgi:hypothetical protein